MTTIPDRMKPEHYWELQNAIAVANDQGEDDIEIYAAQKSAEILKQLAREREDAT